MLHREELGTINKFEILCAYYQPFYNIHIPFLTANGMLAVYAVYAVLGMGSRAHLGWLLPDTGKPNFCADVVAIEGL